MKNMIIFLCILCVFITGCSPETQFPEDFRKQLALRGKREAISQEQLIHWLGQPDCILEVKLIPVAMCDYSNSMHIIEQWYGFYNENDQRSSDKIEWCEDEEYLKSKVWLYFYQTPLAFTVAHREWIGTWKKHSGKVTLCFIEINGKYLAVPELIK